MAEDYAFSPGGQLPAFWLNQIQNFLSGLSPFLTLTVPTSTSVGIAGASGGPMSIPVGGLWRYVSTTLSAAHPGGAAGTYDVVVACSANVIASSPNPYTDNTDYNFYPYIEPTGSVPSGNTPNGQAIAATRKIGEIDWDGTSIIGLRQFVGRGAQSPVTATAPAAKAYAAKFVASAGQTGNFVQVYDANNNLLFGVSPTAVQLGASLFGRWHFRTTAASAAIADGDFLEVTAACTITLPAAAAGGEFIVMPTSNLAVVLSGAVVNSAGQAVATVTVSSFARFAADGTNWRLVGGQFTTQILDGGNSSN